MCAINGFNFRNEELVRKMNRITSHRGPDGTGTYSDDNVSLGHNRLSIIDLSEAGRQPMESFDGKQVIVFNGEIYNFRELKKELRNYPFKSKSDTEVILAAYKKWGSDCVKKFNGIFAFAVWDKEKKELFLVRDHIGVKPLYYFWDSKKFIFSSEIKAILEHDIPRVVDKEAFNHYLRVLYVPEPLTMFKGVYKLPPASFAVLRNGKLEISRYWRAPVGDYLKNDKPEIIKRLKETFYDAVNRQLISDRPVGIYLSGGIDSSTVLHNVAQIRKNIETFSIGFDLSEEEEREKFNKDFELARKTANHYGTKHYEVMISSEDALGLLEKSVWHLDEPIANPTVIPMMELAAFAKSKVAVVLAGDGGDELFGGYERYRLSLISDYYRKLPPLFRKLLNFNAKLKKLDTPPGIERFALFMFQKNGILEKISENDFFNSSISKDFFENKYFSGDEQLPFGDKFLNADRQSWLVDESLMRSDKAAMSAGLEARVPILDKDLAELAARIPFQYKVNLFSTKIILKEAFRKELPEFLFNQPKRGWFSPAAKWLRRPDFNSAAREILSENYCRGTRPIFKWEGVREIFEKHCQKEEYNLTILWAILTFQIWAKLYKIRL